MSARCTGQRSAAALLCFVVLALGLLAAQSAAAEDVKIGVILSSTGRAAFLAPPIADAVKLAVDEINAEGGILNGRQLQAILGDSKSTADDSVAAATKLVQDDKVAAIVGPLTSLTTLAAAEKVTIPNGVLLISPSATAPMLTSMEDKDFVFRVAPSDANEGWVMATLLYHEGLRKVAVTYITGAYGSGINDTFRNNFENYKGTITVALAHEANKVSYDHELRLLTKHDPEALVLIDFASSGGITVIKEALDKGYFKQIIGTDALMDPALIKEVGADRLKAISFVAPTIDHTRPAAQTFEKLYAAAYQTTEGKLYIAQAYDAVMMTALAIEKAGTTDRTKIRDALRQICCGPGEVVGPGDWAKAKADIAAGKKINYEGASGNCDF
ncbi:ABC transporter substrate-binding protein, partial [Hypericibacter sp.]|uniref:ABC transporter substrate-binding protein n=1 Tax=Hypericibacter sp. TaxID=2705401 RepID=UPI003D6D66E5